MCIIIIITDPFLHPYIFYYSVYKTVLTPVLLKDSSGMYLTGLIQLYNSMCVHLKPGNCKKYVMK